MAAGQNFNFIAHFQTACFQSALIAAEVVAAAAVLARHALYGKMRGLVGGILTVDGQAFKQRQKRQTLIPRGLAAGIDDIVAF